MVKLEVLGNNSKTVNNIKNLTRGKNDRHSKIYHGRWFSPDTPTSSTTKTGRHDIVGILLKMALKHRKSNQINQII
jgi:hypothetical protein